MADDVTPKDAEHEAACSLRIVPANAYWRGVMERGGSFACHVVGQSATPPDVGALDEDECKAVDQERPPAPPLAPPPQSSRLVGALGYAEFLNVKEFSETLGVNEKTVYGMIKRKELRASKAGRILRIPVEELSRMRNGVAPEAITHHSKASRKARTV